MKKSIYILVIALIGIALLAVTTISTKATTPIVLAPNQYSIIHKQHSSIEQQVKFTGKVMGYHSENTACFFVDPEMVAHGAAKALPSHLLKGACTHELLGEGVPVFFSELDPNSDYPLLPESEVMIEITGYWNIESFEGLDNISVFYVTSYEPFF